MTSFFEQLGQHLYGDHSLSVLQSVLTMVVALIASLLLSSIPLKIGIKKKRIELAKKNVEVPDNMYPAPGVRYPAIGMVITGVITIFVIALMAIHNAGYSESKRTTYEQVIGGVLVAVVIEDTRHREHLKSDWSEWKHMRAYATIPDPKS